MTTDSASPPDASAADLFGESSWAKRRMMAAGAAARTEIAAVDTVLEAKEEEHASGFLVLPIFATSPETGVNLGVFGLVYWHMGPAARVRPSQIRSAGVVTTKGQLQVDLGSTLWLAENRFTLQPQLIYQYFPRPFFGIGNSAVPETKETYTGRSMIGTMTGLVRVLPSTFVGVRYAFDSTEIVNASPDGLIARNSVRGAEGAVLSGVGPTLVYDDRDNLYAASRGTFATLSLLQYDRLVGSDFRFARGSLDLRHYVSLGRQVLALQLLSTVTRGVAPFYALADIGGGNNLRGVFRGLYRDNNSLQAQADLRIPIFGRLWGSFFIGAGKVGRTVADLVPTEVHPAGGTGLRFIVIEAQKVGIRLDFAYSATGLSYYIDIGEAF